MDKVPEKLQTSGQVPIARQLGHYRVEGRLGEGGMGVVYRAWDTRLERPVAIKLVGRHLLTDRTARARLLREARMASALNHPHICTVYDVGEEEDGVYIVMELVEGRPLSTAAQEDDLPVETLLRHGSQIAEAIEHAHDRGVVHRDLKMANVMITPEGRAKVLDFGLAKRLTGTQSPKTDITAETLTQDGTVIGTLHCLAPELLRGEPADMRSDIWAFGVLLYEMTGGDQPFSGRTTYELTSAILREPVRPLPPTVPAGLRAVILRCLQKEPARRYQRAGEVQAALEALRPESASVAAMTRSPSSPRAAATVESGSIEALAVLPLQNLSGDPEQEYFADGMTEALITDLAKIGALRVTSRTTAMQYKGSRKPLAEIGREMNVDAVVEGSVLRSGERVRITAQLIHLDTDRHLWAESYERDLSDILSLQSEVARAIAQEIRIKLTPQERSRLSLNPTVDPEAYEAYLKGRHFWNKFNKEGLKKAIEYFDEAVEKDPEYAPGYLGLAASFCIAGEAGLRPRQTFPFAREAAVKALELDECLAEAHTTLAIVRHLYEWDWAAAEAGFVRALQLNSAEPLTHAFYARYLAAMGRPDVAIVEAEKGHELDPLSLIVNANFGIVLYFARRYAEAIDHFQKVIEIDPEFFIARHYLGRVYERTSRFDEALAEFLTAADHSRRHPRSMASLGCAYAALGRHDKATRILDELKKLSEKKHVSSYALAELHSALGETDRAFAWLDRAFASREGWLVYMNVEPWLDALRPDPRFQGLLRKLGLPANCGTPAI
jgi:serine/threonine-protein kinase